MYEAVGQQDGNPSTDGEPEKLMVNGVDIEDQMFVVRRKVQ